MTAKVQGLAIPVLAGIALIITGIDTIIGHTVPSNFWTITYVLVGAVAGVALPTAATTTVVTQAPPV